MLMTLDFEQSFDSVLDASMTEPQDFVYPGHGVIGVFSEGCKQPRRIGAVWTSLVNGYGAMDAGFTPFMAADADSVLLGSLYADLFDLDDNSIRPAAMNALAGEPLQAHNILVIERIALLPAVRGYGIAPHVVRQLTQRAGIGTGICALFPRPMQFYPSEFDKKACGGDLELDRLENSDESKATNAVRSYFARHGFRGFAGSSFMVRSMDYPLRQPEPINMDGLPVPQAAAF